jgi:hypothetical protein
MTKNANGTANRGSPPVADDFTPDTQGQSTARLGFTYED